MPINFDKIIDRRNTSCLKYDFAAERGYPADILPFWVADMDFRTPAPVIDALKARAAHGIFGYTQVKDDYFSVLQNWFRTRHDWTVERSDLIITPGVVFAIANAIRTFTKKGESILIQQPVYYPFANMIRQNERVLVDSPLRRALRDRLRRLRAEDCRAQRQTLHPVQPAQPRRTCLDTCRTRTDRRDLPASQRHRRRG